MAADLVAGGLAQGVLAQLEAVPLDPGRPLLVLDADEVLVVFAAHLARFAAAEGIAMRLERYSLEGAFRERRAGAGSDGGAGDGRVLAFDEAIALIHRFVAAETARQAALPGAAAAVARLATLAQIVVLTNVPAHGRAARVQNLAGLGMAYPLVENIGGKGAALAWLAARAGRPAVFVDDSPKQLESAAALAPDVVRVHMTGAPLVADVMPASPHAEHSVPGWAEAEPLLAGLLGR